MKNKLLSGAVFIVISTLLTKVMGVLYKIPLSYILTDEGMGYFNTAYTVFSFLYIITSAGIPKAMSLIVSSAVGAGDEQTALYVYKKARRLFAVLGMTSTVLLLLLSRPLSLLLNIEGSFYSLCLIAPSLFFIAATSVDRGYLSGMIEFRTVAISEIIASLFKLVFGVFCAVLVSRITKSCEVISAAAIGGTTIAALSSYIYLKIKIKTKAEVKIKYADKEIYGKIFSISLPLMLTAFLGNIGSVIDLGIIMRGLAECDYTGYQSTVLYGNYTTLVLPMLTSTSSLISPLLVMILPLVSADRSLTKNQGTVMIMVKLTLSVVFFISLIFAAFPENVLQIVFEDTSASLGAPLLAILAPGIMFFGIQSVTNTLAEGRGKVRLPLYSMLISLAVKLAIIYVLTNRGAFDIYAVPLATTISYAVGLIVSLTCVLKIGEYRRLGITALLLKFTLCFAVLLALSLVTPMLRFVPKCVLISLFYLIFVAFCIFSSEEKGYILSLVTKKSNGNYL